MPIDTPAYQHLSSFSALLGTQQVTYCSKPGLPDWKEVTPSMRLLVSEAGLADGQQVLYLNPGHGAAAAALALANPGAQLTLVATHFTTQQAAQASLDANQAPNARLAPAAEPDPQARFDCVLLDLPKGRSLARRQLRQAFEALLPGGTLYLSGPKDLGVETVIKDAGQLFSSVSRPDDGGSISKGITLVDNDIKHHRRRSINCAAHLPRYLSMQS